jgi:hypothetical protein
MAHPSAVRDPKYHPATLADPHACIALRTHATRKRVSPPHRPQIQSRPNWPPASPQDPSVDLRTTTITPTWYTPVPHFNCRLLPGRIHPDSPQRPITVSTATPMAPPRLGIGTDAGIRMRQKGLVWGQCSRWFLGTCLRHLTGACCTLALLVLPVASEPNNQYTNTQSRLALLAMVFQTDIPTPAMPWEGPGRSYGRS